MDARHHEQLPSYWRIGEGFVLAGSAYLTSHCAAASWPQITFSVPASGAPLAWPPGRRCRLPGLLRFRCASRRAALVRHAPERQHQAVAHGRLERRQHHRAARGHHVAGRVFTSTESSKSWVTSANRLLRYGVTFGTTALPALSVLTPAWDSMLTPEALGARTSAMVSPNGWDRAPSPWATMPRPTQVGLAVARALAAAQRHIAVAALVMRLALPLLLSWFDWFAVMP